MSTEPALTVYYRCECCSQSSVRLLLVVRLAAWLLGYFLASKLNESSRPTRKEAFFIAFFLREKFVISQSANVRKSDEKVYFFSLLICYLKKVWLKGSMRMCFLSFPQLRVLEKMFFGILKERCLVTEKGKKKWFLKPCFDS